MNPIYETDNFVVIIPEHPHVSREDGGHIIITPKERLEDRTKLSPTLAYELTKLTMIVGEAMKTVMNRNSIDVERINYQDNGNWNLSLHVHLYGRAKSAKVQKYGTPLKFPPSHEELIAQLPLESLNEKEVTDLKVEIGKLLQTKYKDF